MSGGVVYRSIIFVRYDNNDERVHQCAHQHRTCAAASTCMQAELRRHAMPPRMARRGWRIPLEIHGRVRVWPW